MREENTIFEEISSWADNLFSVVMFPVAPSRLYSFLLGYASESPLGPGTEASQLLPFAIKIYQLLLSQNIIGCAVPRLHANYHKSGGIPWPVKVRKSSLNASWKARSRIGRWKLLITANVVGMSSSRFWRVKKITLWRTTR
jgi:hypothetical protein